MKNLNCFAGKFSLMPSRLIFQQRPEKSGEIVAEGAKPDKPDKPNKPNTPEKGGKIVDKAAEALKKAEFQQLKAKIEEVTKKIAELPKDAPLEKFAELDRQLVPGISSQITDRLGINLKDETLAEAERMGLEFDGFDRGIKIENGNIVITNNADFILKEDAWDTKQKKPYFTVETVLTIRPDFTFTRGITREYK